MAINYVSNLFMQCDPHFLHTSPVMEGKKAPLENVGLPQMQIILR